MQTCRIRPSTPCQLVHPGNGDRQFFPPHTAPLVEQVDVPGNSALFGTQAPGNGPAYLPLSIVKMADTRALGELLGRLFRSPFGVRLEDVDPDDAGTDVCVGYLAED
jgi:hypothetical protein